MVNRSLIRVVAVLAILPSLLAPAGASAGEKASAPYPFAFADDFCVERLTESYGAARCAGSADADAVSGEVDFNVAVNGAGASTGAVFALGIIGGTIFLDKPAKRLRVTAKIDIGDATAITPTPVSAAATGSFAAVVIGLGVAPLNCETGDQLDCVKSKNFVIAASGTPPETPAVAAPPTVPEGTPTSVSNRTITLKATLKKVPAGAIGYGVVVQGIGVLGGGQYDLGPAGRGPVMPDTGSVRAIAAAEILKITAG